MPAFRVGFLAAAALAVGALGCGRWVDGLACHDEGCRFTSEEWDRVRSLTGLGDPPADRSNEILTHVLEGSDPLANPGVGLGWVFFY
jgi:hypothetical protein